MNIELLTKAEQRKFFLKKRDNIIDAFRKSEKICDYFCRSDIYNNLSSIMVYVSFRSEVETVVLIKQIIADKGRVVVPKCVVETKQMKIYEVKDFEQLENGAYGILEPCSALISNGEIKEIQKSEVDAVITPAAAFDKRGFRLGYGAGYYDRFFENYFGVKIGFQFSECICERLSNEEDDVPVDIIFSELGCMVINDSCRL